MKCFLCLFSPFYDRFLRQFYSLYIDEVNETGFSIYANFPLPKELEESIIRSKSEEQCTNVDVMDELLEKDRKCMLLFSDFVRSTTVPIRTQDRFYRRGLSLLPREPLQQRATKLD